MNARPRAAVLSAAALFAATVLAGGAAALPLPVGTDEGVRIEPVSVYGAQRDAAVVVTAPASFTAPVRVPKGGRLISAVAVPDRVGATSVVETAEPLRFRVLFESGDEVRTIYERTIDIAAEPRDRRWFDFGRDLSPLAGREGALRFETAPTRSEARAGTMALWAPPQVASCENTGPSLLLVVADALRADRLGAAGYKRPTTPHLDAFAAGATRFEAAFSAGPKTIPSVPQILTGTYFFRHRTTPGLAAFLGPGRFEFSRAVVNNPYVARWLAGESPGFETIVAGELDARAVTSEALRWLTVAGRCRTALYLHYLDTHTPYHPPQRYARMFVEDAPTTIGLSFADVTGAWQNRYGSADRRRIVDLYDGAVAWTDRQLGRLLRGLGRRGLAPRTIVVVTSDHGEEFWEHGQFFHGQSLYDEQLHVPLVILVPGQKTGRVVGTLASTVDVMPTIAAAAGFPATPGDGVSLVPLAIGAASGLGPSRTVFATVSHAEPRSPPRQAVRTKTRKLIRNVADGTIEFYDLAADPRERRNLGSAAPGAAEMSAALDAVRLSIADRGYRLRVRSTGERPSQYRVTIVGDPPVPIVEPDRLTLERGDRLHAYQSSSALAVGGTIEPGDEDDVRMDIPVAAGTMKIAITLDGEPAPPGTLRLGAGARVAGESVELADPALAGEPESAPADVPPVAVFLWRAGGALGGSYARPEPTPDEQTRERLRALGYVE